MNTFKTIMIWATVVLVTASLAFGYAGLYCLNSGEPDLAGGLWFTFALPAFGIGFTTLLAGFIAQWSEA